jgi:hypothetical protein
LGVRARVFGARFGYQDSRGRQPLDPRDGVPYTLDFRRPRKASASTRALLSLIEPLTAAVLAALVLGSRLSATGTAGAVMLLGGVVRAGRTDVGTG